MKTLSKFIVAGVAFSLALSVAFADEKEQSIKGEGMCAKCELKETKTCQNVIKVKKGDKSIVYYLEQNDVSKGFHKNLCSSTAKVSAMGTVKEVDGKQMLTVSKIEMAK